jgi:hypothetical protein
MLAKRGALSPSLLYIDPDEYAKRIVDSEIFSTDILYIIFGGLAAGFGFGFGISKFFGSLLEEAGKDMYYKVIQYAYCNEQQITK